MTANTPGASEPTQAAHISRRFSSGVGLVMASLGVMWLIEIVDSVFLDSRLEGGGIHPRALDGIDGVLWAPWLHGGFGHLISNSIPFILLGLLVVVHGRTRLIEVAVGVTLLGGGLTWVFARSGNHIGVSGVVFGFLGYLITAAFAARSVRSILTGLIAIVLYGGLLWGVLPSPGISWEGHLFGGIAGAAMAVFLGDSKRFRRSAAAASTA